MNKDKSRGIGQVFIGISIYLAVLAALGLFNFFILSYNGIALDLYSFWLPTIFGSLMYAGLYIATAVMRYSSQEFKDKEYINNEESILKHRASIIGEKFRKYINDIDFKNKREAWEQKIQTKLANHQMLLTHGINQKIQNVPEDKWGIVVRWYVRREKKLRLFLTEGWIKSNLKFRIMVYPRLTVNEVINGRMRSHTRMSMLNRNHLGKQITAKIVWLLFSVIGSAIFATLAITPNPTWLNVIVQIVGMVVFIVVNTTTGFLAGSKAHKSRLDTSIERLEIISNFIRENKDIEQS